MTIVVFYVTMDMKKPLFIFSLNALLVRTDYGHYRLKKVLAVQFSERYDDSLMGNLEVEK